MPQFIIHEGDQWPDWDWDRLRYNLPPLTRSREQTWDCKIDWGDCPPGTAIKLTGFIDFTPFNCEREHWSHFAHTTSDRIVAVHYENLTRVRAYGYRDGVGGVTGSGRYARTIASVPNGEWFSPRINILDDWTEYSLVGRTSTVAFKHGSRSCFRSWALCHADSIHGNAPDGQAPSDIRVFIERPGR